MRFILGFLLCFAVCSVAQAQEPEPRYEFPSYMFVPKLSSKLPATNQAFDPSKCVSGYIIRGGQVGRDFYFVLDCLDNESLEQQN